MPQVTSLAVLASPEVQYRPAPSHITPHPHDALPITRSTMHCICTAALFFSNLFPELSGSIFNDIPSKQSLDVTRAIQPTKLINTFSALTSSQPPLFNHRTLCTHFHA